jgi:hypothetical protein
MMKATQLLITLQSSAQVTCVSSKEGHANDSRRKRRRRKQENWDQHLITTLKFEKYPD